MKVKIFPVGWLATNCYVVSCEETKEAAVIDPGMETEAETQRILDYIKQNGFKVKYIINTHGHDDHTSGNYAIKETTGAPILIHKNTIERVDADKKLQEGDILQVGNFKLTVLHTPGHTPCGISLLADDAVFTGDTLFAGSVGRTDFLGGSYQDIMQSIKNKLMSLPDSLTVYCGHGPSTTIGVEKRYNPFLQR